MELLDILQLIGSSLGAFAVAGMIKVIIWAAKADAKLQRYAERFDGSGTRRGIFTRLDDIEHSITEESKSLREAGAREHASIREDMVNGFKDTDTLIDGAKEELNARINETKTEVGAVRREVSEQVGEVRHEVAELRGELRGRKAIGPGADE